MLFQIGDNIVPASSVDEISPEGGKHPRALVTLRNGATLHGYVTCLETIPNTTRLEAVRVWDPDVSDGYSIVPILAWRVEASLNDYDEGGGALSSPVLAETLASNEDVGILDPETGVVTLPEDQSFRSVEEFVAEISRRRAEKATKGSPA
jgi:hypothetical protein